MLQWNTLRGNSIRLKVFNKTVRAVLSFVLVFSVVFTDVISLLTNGFPIIIIDNALIGSQNAMAATGDFSIFREVAGGDSVVSSAPLDITWDTSVAASGNIILQGNNSDIDLTEGGKYLVMYNIWTEEGGSTGGGNRRSHQSWLTLAGTPLEYGRGGGYIRDTDGTTFSYNSGSAIIDAVAGDDLQVIIQRDDANTTAGMEVRPGTNGISVLKLKDTWDYLRIHTSATSSNIAGNTTFTDVAWDTSDEVDTGSFGFTPTSGDITLKGDDNDHFLVTSNIRLNMASGGSQRENYEMILTLDGTEILGSRVSAYIRGSINGNNDFNDTLVYSGVVQKDAIGDQTLNIEVRRESTSSGGNTVIMADQSALSIVALPDEGSYVMLGNNTTAALSSSRIGVDWNTQQEVDTAAFSHSTVSNPSRINIDTDGDYLFFSTLYLNTSVDNRQPFRADWQKNGNTLLDYGGFGQYSRDGSAFSAGASGGLIMNSLSASDYIEVTQFDETGTPPGAAFQADRVAIQGILLDDNFYGTDVFVSASSTQVADTNIPTTNFYTGDQFVINERTSSRNMTGVTVTESGSVDAANGIKNVKLFYDLDTTAPYDCTGESYGGVEAQFGSTDTNGFSGADGSSSFTDAVAISTTQGICLYPVVDVVAGSVDGDTLELSINDTATDVIFTASPSVGPVGTVALTGSTTLRNAELTQVHYHWLNNDGNEGVATSIDGTEDTPAIGFTNGTIRRLRMQISAEGSISSDSTSLRLEYAQKATTCGDAASWTDVGASGGDWDMADNGFFLVDGLDSSDQTVANGGTTNENTTHLAPNGALKDTSSQIAALTFSSANFLEAEFSIEPTATAPQGNTYCFRMSDAGTSLRNYDIYAEGTISADIDVSASGAQTTSLDLGSVAQYVGGTFVVERAGGNRTLNAITITETGTIDAINLTNPTLYYDLDTTAPIDCASESFSGGETPVVAGTPFSGENGSSTFSGLGVSVGNSQSFCGYVVFDVGSGASDGETVNIQISDPSVDVDVTASTVGPSTAVSPTGNTTVAGPVLTQTHYHWRNDDGDETDAGATSASGGVEDTGIDEIAKEITQRIRLQVSNQGSVTSEPVQYQLEYGTKVVTCEGVGTWTNVGAVGGAFDMSLSPNIVDGNTTNISNAANGAMTEENTTFVGTGALRETEATSSAITLTSTQYTELEYSLEATVDSGFDTTYCFRVTDVGTELQAYSNYPELTTREKQDYFIQRGVTNVSGTGVTLVAGVDYTAPSSATAAFIRITTTQITGAGRTAGNVTQNANSVTAYFENPENIVTSVTIGRPSTATEDTRVTWEIIEYTGVAGADNEMIVRDQGTITHGSSATVATGTSIAVTDDTDVVVFVTGQTNDNNGSGLYNAGLSTSDWANSTNEPVITRAVSGSVSEVSYAVVEFTGVNWDIQRVEHEYSSLNTEFATISAVSSLSRTLTHIQKRVGAGENGLHDIGQEVWLGSIGSVFLQLQDSPDPVSSPSDHTAVIWVMENTQTGVGEMSVQRPSGALSTGACGGIEPCAENIGIAPVKESNATIAGTNRSTGGGTAFPRPMVGLRILPGGSSAELWRNDTGQTQTYRLEITQWPVAETSVRQNYYRFYVDNDALDPTDPWPVGGDDLGENTSITGSDDPLGEAELVRIRMTLLINNATLPQSTTAFKLQYGLQDGTCSAISVWTDVGAPASGVIWRGSNGTTVDGTELATSTPAAGTLNISISDVAGTYEEENNSAVNPYSVDIGEDVEYDWLLEHNGAAQRSDYCFRMVYSDGTELNSYVHYPTLRTTGYTPVVLDWRWYDDETNDTPTTPLAAENVAPVDLANGDIIKLRVIASEVENAGGTNIKFGLQYSQYADFSDGGTFLTSTSSCVATSTWCYEDGGGVDNDVIQESVLVNTDTCILGVGTGCGTHNEAATTTSTFSHLANANTEFEFVVKHAGARTNGVYYFRLYDVSAADSLPAAVSYPSLVTEGPQLVFTIAGLPAGTVTAGITTDANTTATAIGFGNLLFDTSSEAAQRLTIATNATEGYQLLKYATQQLLNAYGDPIPPVTSTNAVPAGWATSCTGTASGCFGYHSTDATLEGGSGRFAPVDSYAAVTTTAEEIMYSSLPTTDIHDVVYRVQVSEEQPAGDYQTNIVYIAIPSF
jgi:hypothetical protein